jgi:hypothetical protein
MNPDRETNYLPDHVLEGAVAILHSACLTGRKYIGQNAIAEGAMKLQKATDCVITESMLDAALNAVEHGSGLKIIGSILKEAAAVVQEAKEAKETKKLSEKLGGAVKKAVKAVGNATGVNQKREAAALSKKAKSYSGQMNSISKKVADKAKEKSGKLTSQAKKLNKVANKRLAITGAIAGGVIAGGIAAGIPCVGDAPPAL